MQENIPKSRYKNLHLLLPPQIGKSRSPCLYYQVDQRLRNFNKAASLQRSMTPQILSSRAQLKSKEQIKISSSKNVLQPHRCQNHKCLNPVAKVKYYKNHLCGPCRSKVKTQDGRSVVVFLQQGEIICLAKSKWQSGRRVYQFCDPEQLMLQGERVHATFAGQDQLVLVYK